MLTGFDQNQFYDFGDYAYSGSALNITPAQDNNINFDAIFGWDEFRMFVYKIKRCTRTRTHDWTECPYAHRGEKATRRDPRKVSYVAIACSGFRNGKCHRGDACEFAHGVFEYWLHPARYRTRACNAGQFCQREVCFFAHTADQLRTEKKYACPFVYKARMNGTDGALGYGSGGDNGSNSISTRVLRSPAMMDSRLYFEGVSQLLMNRIRNLKIRVDSCDDHQEQGDARKINGGLIDESEDVLLPHDLDWVSELVN